MAVRFSSQILTSVLPFGILHADIHDLVVEVLRVARRRSHLEDAIRDRQHGKRQKCHHPCRRSARCRKKPPRDLDHRLVAGSKTSTRTSLSGQAPAKKRAPAGRVFSPSELGLHKCKCNLPSCAVPRNGRSFPTRDVASNAHLFHKQRAPFPQATRTFPQEARNFHKKRAISHKMRPCFA